MAADPGGMALLTTVGGGPLAGIVAGVEAAKGAEAVEKPDREHRLLFTYKYFLNGKYIGDIGSGQYMALDLPPDMYKVFFKQPAATSAVPPVDLQAGETEVVLANVGKLGSMGAYWAGCNDDCEALIRDGHRVAADLSGIEDSAPTPPRR